MTLLFLAALVLFASKIIHLETFAGFYDFEVYYSASKAMHIGNSPYSFEVISAIRSEHGLSQRNLVFPYPSALLPIIYPLAWFSYSQALALWFLGSVALFSVSAAIVWYGAGGPSTRVVAGIMAFFVALPPMVALEFGQLVPLVVLGVALFSQAAKSGSNIRAGIGLTLMSLKHLLFYSVAPIILWWILKTKKWRVLVCFVASSLFLFILAELLSPASFEGWLSIRKNAFQILLESNNNTISDLIQNIALRSTGALPIWPLILCPIIGMILIFLVATREKIDQLDWVKKLPYLMAISLTFAPYGWLFDCAIMSLAQVIVVAEIMQADLSPRSRALRIGTLGTFQIGVWILSINTLHGLHQFFWYPAILAVLGCMVRPVDKDLERRKSGPPGSRALPI